MTNKIQPRLPKGMRDFLPADVLRREYVIDTVSEVFELHGYEPLQTPVMELAETLMGKYGEDAERLIYYAKHPQAENELALRYDLTVPLARFYAMHESEVSLPFKRYHIAPVWRAERPQQGRYREFYQCDADTVGIAGMEADAESVSVVVMAMSRLGFNDFRVKINNRKLLTGIGQYAGLSGEPLANLYRTIDKLDKIGVDGVRGELIKVGIDEATANKIMDMIAARSTDPSGYEAGASMLGAMRELLESVPTAMEGLNELESMHTVLKAMGVPGNFIEFDFSMVRGLGYYTGPIFETVLMSDDPEERVGSVSGGGRYDDLIGLFRKQSLPTVGVSLGIERLIHIMGKRNLYPPSINRTVVQVLVTVFGNETRSAALSLVNTLRNAGIKAELFMQENRIGKIGQQIGYADKKGIPVVALLGSDEMARGEVKFKRLSDQREVTATADTLVQVIRDLLG
jgi:histidyl-tRNA synthetase